MLTNRPKVIELLADHSAHSHFAVVGDNGEILWEEADDTATHANGRSERAGQQAKPEVSGNASNEEQYREIFQNSIVGMFQTSPDGRFINVNTALAKIFGYDSPKDLINNIQNIQRQLYVNPKDRDAANDLVRRMDS